MLQNNLKKLKDNLSISFLLNLVSSTSDTKEKELYFSYFLYSQKDDSNFEDIKHKLFPLILEWWDASVKIKLINYFEKYAIDTFSHEVIDMLCVLEQNIKTKLNVKHRIAIIIRTLDQVDDTGALVSLVINLLESEDHNIVYTTTESLKDIVYIFTFPQLQTIITKLQFISWIIAKDAATVVGSVLQNTDHAEQMIEEYMNIYDKILSTSTHTKKPDRENFRYSYVSSRWLLNQFDDNKRKYEQNPDERFARELRYSLDILHGKDPKIAHKVCELIVQKAHYSIYFEVLNRFLKDKQKWYDDILETILCNSDAWSFINASDKGRYDLFHWLLVRNDKVINNFEEKLIKYSASDDFGTFTQAQFAAIISEKNRSQPIKYIIAQEKKRIEQESDVSDYDFWPRNDDHDDELFARWWTTFDRSLLESTKTIDELKKIITDYINNSNNFDRDLWDLIDPFKDYFAKNPEQLDGFYKEIRDLYNGIEDEWLQNRWSWFVWSIVQWYLDTLDTKKPIAVYKKVIALYEQFSQWSDNAERQAKKNIASFLQEWNELLRSKETENIEDWLRDQLLDLIEQLVTDSNPDDNENYELVWLNSVRWMWVKCLGVMSFYFPDDESIITLFRQVSEDTNKGIQAGLIENLVYLIPDHKNYELCKEIITKFENEKEEVIQKALVYYMFKLGKLKLTQNKELIKKLISTPYQSVQQYLWDLLWQALLHDIDMNDIVDLLIQQKNTVVLNSIIDQLMRKLVQVHSWNIFDLSFANYCDVLSNIFKAIVSNVDVYSDVIQSIGYDFDSIQERTENLFLDFFPVFEKIAEIKSQIIHNRMQEVIVKIIDMDISPHSLEKIIDLLLSQKDKSWEDWKPLILWLYCWSSEFSKIVEVFYKNMSTYSPKMFSKVEQLFDEGLKYWWDEFYKIFDECY